MINAVVFDVSETLVDESREYGTWADWLGVPRHTFSAERIRHRPAEIAAVTEHKARCFVITRGGATLHHQQGRHPHGSSRAWPVHLLGTDGPDLAPLSVAVPTAISGFRSVRQQHAADLQSLDATRHIFRGKLSEDLVHDLGALDQDRAEFLPVDDLSCP